MEVRYANKRPASQESECLPGSKHRRQIPDWQGFSISMQKRQQKEQTIRQALEAGKLYVRGVRTEPVTGYPQLGETEQNNPRRVHRPVSCLKQGHPLFDRKSVFVKDKFSLYILLDDCKPVFCYKEDVGTCRSLVTNSVKKNLSGVNNLQGKMVEQYDRWASIYPPVTSGHLTSEGTFASGHKKKLNESFPPYPEVLIEPYSPLQYVGVLIPDKLTCHEWADMLTSLQIIMQLEGCPKTLPLVFFEERRGWIRSITWSDQLPVPLKKLQEAADKLARLPKDSQQLINYILFFSPAKERLRLLSEAALLMDSAIPARKLPDFEQEVQQELSIFESLTGTSPDWRKIITLLCQLPKRLPYGYDRSIFQTIMTVAHEIQLSSLTIEELDKLLGGFVRFCLDSRLFLKSEYSVACSNMAFTLYNKGARCAFNIKIISCLPELAFSLLADKAATSHVSLDQYPFLVKELITRKLINRHNFEPVKRFAEQCAGSPELLDSLAITDITYILEQQLNFCRYGPNKKKSMEKMYSRILSDYKTVILGLVQMGAQVDTEALGKQLPKPNNEPVTEILSGLTGELIALKNEIERYQGGEEWLKTRAQFANSKPVNWLVCQKDLLLSYIPREPNVQEASYDMLGEKALTFYYRKPDPSVLMAHAIKYPDIRIEQADIDLRRKFHGVDHVVRTWILAEALLPLFEKNDPPTQALLTNRTQLRELIPLALVWHDAVAEDKPKELEESEAARLFYRDMNNTGQYNEDDIKLVACALHNKNNRTQDKQSGIVSSAHEWDCSDEDCSPDERLVRYLVRLPDCIDIIRVTSVDKDWCNLDISTPGTGVGFDPAYLDIPNHLRKHEQFKKEFAALMKGAKDLAWVTGGQPRGDFTDTPYNQRYNLQIDNEAVREKVHYSANAKQTVMQALDDNVRRWYARTHLKLSTCQADHSKETLKKQGGRAICLVTLDGQDRLTAIHSTTELRQIQLPETLTTTEKLQVEDLGLTDTALQQCHALNSDIYQKHSIPPLLGTLSQETLKSLTAQKVLNKQRQLKVIEKQTSYFEEYEIDACLDSNILEKVYELDKLPLSSLTKRQFTTLEAVPMDQDK